MSGHCDWCQLWHSGGCFHPGRYPYAAAQDRIAELETVLTAILASDGSQGVFDAIKCFDAHKMAEQVMKKGTK